MYFILPIFTKVETSPPHRDTALKEAPKKMKKVKKVELVEMRRDGEAVYSGPTLPPLSPGERAEVSADMASCFCRFCCRGP